MNENEIVPFDQMPQLHTGSFLTKEQAEQFRGTFKNLTVVVRCKDCKKHNSWECWQYFLGRIKIPDNWFCADGVKRE